MLRRVAPLLVIAGTVAFVFLTSRGQQAGAPTACDRRAAPSAQELEAEPLELSPADPAPLREVIRPTKSPADRMPGERASVKEVERVATRGRVVDDEGTPWTGFTIEAKPLASRGRIETKRFETFESPDGGFDLGELSCGQWRLTAHIRDGRSSAQTIINVPETTGEVELVIPRSATLSGSVVARSGPPVGDAQVYLHYPGEEEIDFTFGDPPEPRARTDAGGNFSIESVAPGSVEIMARHPDYADSGWRPLVAAPGAQLRRIEIELSAGGRIEGRADPSLGDVVDRQVNLFSFRGALGWREERSDATGHFVIDHVVPQDYVIELRPAGYGQEERHQQVQNEPGIRRNISVKEGETTHVVFGEAQRRIAIHGLVLAGRAPASGWEVRPYSKEIEDRGERATTGADGRFELTLSAPGDYWFTVSNDGSYVHVEQAVPDQSDVDVLLEVPSGALSGRVTDAGGRPLSRIGITLVLTGCNRDEFHRACYHRTRTGSGGKFLFPFLRPGTYTLRAPDGFLWDSPPPRSPHGRGVMTDLVIGGTEVAGIELRLPEEGRISGDVVDDRGFPVTNAWIGVVDRTGLSLSGDGWDTRPDATGHFEIGSVGPGSYSVRVRSGEKEARSAPFEVEAGTTASVRIELR